MAIEGPLRELGIHDVFQLLDLSRKTGVLRVTSALRDNEGTVVFREGRVISAAIRSNPHPLGAVLVRAGRITEAQLTQARSVQLAPGERRRLGEIMVSLGIISARDLERVMRRQIEAVVFELMSWQEGFFSFTEGASDDTRSDGIASVTTEALLMEGARRLDEWTVVQQRVPGVNAVPVLADVPDEHPPILDLLPHEWEVLAMVDGARDVRTIAHDLGRDDFETAKIVFGLIATSIAEVRRAVIPASEPLQPSMEGHLAEAQRALINERVADALEHSSSALTLAPSSADARTLIARALFKDGRDAEGEEQLREALQINPRHTGALMEAGRLAARRGELERAVSMWAQVAEIAVGTPLAAQARQAMEHASQLTAVLEAVDV